MSFAIEKAKKTGARPRSLVEIDYSGGGLFHFSDKQIGVGAYTYSPVVLEWPKLSSQIVPGDNTIKYSSWHCVLSNNPRIDGDIDYRYGIRLYLWFEGTAASERFLLFSGVIHQNIQWDVYQISFDCIDDSFYFNKEVGNLLDAATYPGADIDDLNKVIPIGYGNIYDHECLSIDAGGASTLSVDITAGATSIILTDASKFPSSGMLLIGEETDITYTGKTSNTLTGVTNVTYAYSRGTPVLESVASVKYIAFDHAVKSLTNPRILPFNSKLTNAVAIAAGDITLNINDSGKATATITDIQAVQRDVVAAITQPNHISTDHRHDVTGNIVVTVFYSDFTFTNLTGSGSAANLDHAVNGNLVDAAGANWNIYTTFLYTAFRSILINYSGIPYRSRIRVKYWHQDFSTSNPTFKFRIKYYQGSILRENTQLSSSLNVTQIYTSAWYNYPGGYTWPEVSDQTKNRSEILEDDTFFTETLIITEVWEEIEYTPTDVTVDVNRSTDVAINNSVADPIGGTLLIDAEGYADDGVGHYTGTANALILKPTHVLHHIIETYANWPTMHGYIDIAGTFTTTAAALPPSYKLEFVLREQISLNKLLAVLASQAFCRIFYDRMLYKCTKIKDDETTIVKVLTAASDSILLDGRMAVRADIPDIANIINTVSVLYDNSEQLGGWGSEKAYQRSVGDSNASSITKYDTRKKTYLFFANGRNDTMASDIASRIVGYWRYPKKYVYFPAYLDSIDLERGDLVLIYAPPLDFSENADESPLYELIEIDYTPANGRDNKGPIVWLKFIRTTVWLDFP